MEIIIILLITVIIAMAVFLIPRKPKLTIEQIEKKHKEEREEEYIQAILSYNISKARGEI